MTDTALPAIERQEWLDSVGDPLTEAVHSAFPGEVGQRIKNALHGTWLGHPFHPLLTDIPIGAWMTSMVLWSNARTVDFDTSAKEEPALHSERNRPN